MIRYHMPQNGHLSIRVYDAAGRLVRTLKNGEEIAGFRSVKFDGRNDSGRRLPSGVYYCHMVALGKNAAQKVVIVN
jgi:flagellar hook assembly protein FlgD